MAQSEYSFLRPDLEFTGDFGDELPAYNYIKIFNLNGKPIVIKESTESAGGEYWRIRFDTYQHALKQARLYQELVSESFFPPGTQFLVCNSKVGHGYSIFTIMPKIKKGKRILGEKSLMSKINRIEKEYDFFFFGDVTADYNIGYESEEEYTFDIHLIRILPRPYPLFFNPKKNPSYFVIPEKILDRILLQIDIDIMSKLFPE